MSFEVIDNGIQVGLFLLFALFSLIHGIRKQDRRFWILSGCYACFSMGTLYYLIYLVIMEKCRRSSTCQRLPGWHHICSCWHCV